jgi:hypothetical protein
MGNEVDWRQPEALPMSQASSRIETINQKGKPMANIEKQFTAKVILEAGASEADFLKSLKDDIGYAMTLHIDGVTAAEIVGME